jgi:hypothetical protein
MIVDDVVQFRNGKQKFASAQSQGKLLQTLMWLQSLVKGQ